MDNHTYGIELNVALMEMPPISEDGKWISERYLPKLSFKPYNRRDIDFGNSMYPLDIYGGRTTMMKFHLDKQLIIGDVVREET